ncbi:hypothetical protein TNCV_1039741 [Trichonephila clavipes]|nr:hypothetical protein TNCV_1039741 [Trichonephila clavipes]
MGPGISGKTLTRNSKAWNGVLLHRLLWRSPPMCRKKVREENSRIKTMFIPFFDSQGIIHKEFIPEETTMNAERYIESLTRFMKCLSTENDPSTHNKVRSFLFMKMLVLTQPISSNSSWQKGGGGCKLNIYHTRQISILQTFAYSHVSNSL